MKRREFLKGSVLAVSGALGLALLEQTFVLGSTYSKKPIKQLKPLNTPRFKLRPPGSSSLKHLMANCIKCGQCVRACPFDVLKLDEVGLPYFTASLKPCYLCDALPCVQACPSNALNKQVDRTSANMGIAAVDESTCVAFFGVQCDACYRACPLIDSAIKLAYIRNERTNKHAKLVPVINPTNCVGCGCCEHACISAVPSITVVPFDMLKGQRNDNYVKGWVEGDDEILKNVSTEHKVDQNAALNYLNGEF